MAATTSLIIAGASAAATAGQAVAANKRRKADEQAAKSAAARLKGISETDYMAGLQVPTMGYNLAQEGVQQQVATGVQALKDAGTAGVIGGLPTLTQQSNQANLELAADLQQQEYQRDLAQAENKQQIEGRRVKRDYDIAAGELEGAQISAAENRQIVNDSITSGLGAIQTGYGQYLEDKALYSPKAPTATIQGAMAPFRAPLSSTLLGGKDVDMAPLGTRRYLDNKSYAPGQTPFGAYPGLSYGK